MGTRAFSAPETIPDDYEETFQYTNAVDMWSLGCVIYNILAHSLPYKNSRAKNLPFPTQPLEDRVDSQGVNLLECLLRVDPSTRWTAQEAVKHPWLEASGEASFAAAEDAAGIARSVAQPERPNESQDKPVRLDEQVDMPTFIPSMEKTCPKSKDQTETPINQLISQSPEFRGKNGQIVSRSDNDGRGRKTSNTLTLPTYRVSDSFEDPGTETLRPRRAKYHLPKNASRGSREGNTINKPASSLVTPTIVSRTPRQISKLASTSASRDKTSSLDTTDPSWEGILGELKSMGITEDQIEDKIDFIRDYIQKREAKEALTTPPVTPTTASIPSNIGLGIKSSGSDNRDEGAKQKEPSVKVHHNSLAMQRHQITEEQAEENMNLVTTLHDIKRQEGNPEQNKIATALELIRKGVDLELRSNGDTALHLAVRICCFKNAGHATQIFHELLERGADVNAFNGVGKTALHIAVIFGSPHHNENEIEIVRQLLRYKADVNAKRLKVLRTPLHYAAEYSSVECINVLLAAGARINELDEQGQTALHVSCSYLCYGGIIAEKLILAGIDINVIDKTGKTALDIAVRRKSSDVIEVIKAKQVALDMARDGKNVQHVRGNRGRPRTTSSIPQGRSWRSLFALGKHKDPLRL